MQAVSNRPNVLDDLERSGVALGVLLRLEKALANLHQERISIMQHSIDRLSLGRPLLER